MKVRHIISFIVDKEKGRPDGKLRMRVRWGGDNRVAVNVGYRVTLDKWSMDSQRCKANTTHGPKKDPASEINSEIQRYEQAAESAFDPFETEGREPSEAEYRESLRAALGRSSASSGRPLTDYFREFIGRNSVERGWSELSKGTICNTLYGICKEYPALTLREMATEEWMASWLSDMTRKNLRNTTIRNKVARAKTFLRWARKNGYVGEAVSFTPRIKTVPHKIVWLEWGELMRLFNAELGSGRRNDELARDMFCLSSFTSLRLSDMRNLKWTDIDEVGIHRVLQKTSVPITIEFNKYSRAIIERWRGWTSSGIHVFGEYIPHSSSLIYSIQQIAKDLGFDRPITETYFVGAKRMEKTKPLHERLNMHCGRKTFICNALEMGISPEVVMQWTGHADYNSMKPYIAVSERAKASAMASFDK